MNRKALYWICQIGGWSFFYLQQSVYFGLLYDSLSKQRGVALLCYLLFGMFLSHCYRTLIVKADWLRYRVARLIPRILITTIALGAVLYYFQRAVQYIISNGETTIFDLSFVSLVDIMNLALIYLIWSLIYFLFHYVENYRKAEIENLKWQASINEIELNKLKSQLNPHFMFNAMNSIRALVDEDPAKAKNSITQLSNILRNTLQMGKNKVIPFDQEYKLVKDYLDLEATRYEERLKVSLDIDPQSERFEVPPLMLQTLVENGIKHGISKLPEGGKISIITKVGDDKLNIYIRNSGQMNGIDAESGFGLKNTRQRLQLLYGEKALLNISNENTNTVLTELIIPKLN